MPVELEVPTEESKRLQRCINDLVGLLGLSASWIGRDPSHIARTLLDALEGMLALDLVFLRLIHPSTGAPIAMARVAPGRQLPARADALGEMLDQWLDRDPRQWPPVLRKRLGEGELSLLPLQVGLQSDFGVLIAGSERADFPSETERMLLTVAKNQAVIALQEARLLGEQKLLAETLEQRVAERAAELAAANQGLWQSEARETAILNSALDCIVTIDHEGRITEFNPAAERTFGHHREDVLGAVLGDLIVPPALRERHRQGMARYLATGHGAVIGKRVEMTALRADGTEFPVELAITRIPGDGPPSFIGYLRDITERRQAEERLRESERESRLIVDSIPGLVATFTPGGELEFVNRQIVEYFGRTLEDLKRWGTDDTTHPEDNPRVMELFTRAIESGEPFEWESRARRFDGVYRWLQTRGFPVRDADGHIVRWYNLLIDIDERKRAEQALAAGERDLKLIIDTIPALAWSAGPDGSAEFFNQHYLDFVGLTADQARNWGWTAAVHPDDLNGVAGAWQRIMASGAPGETEARLRRQDGAYRWFLFRTSPLRDENGRIVKWYGVNTDIEDRKRVEAELRRSEAFLAEAQRLSLTGSFSWRVATDEITWSDQVYRIFGLDPAEPMTLERIGMHVHPDDRASFSALVERARVEGLDFEQELRLLLPDRSVRYLHVVAHAIRNPVSGLEYMGAVQDVTERRRAQEELDRARSELTRVARVTSLGTLAASIAHEVNQPLSGIVTNASTCLRMLAAEPPNLDGARETARRTIRDGHRASEVVTRLRGLFTRKEVFAESVDLNAATREVIALTASDLRRGSVVVREELADDLPTVTGDRVQLQQVILNLLLNAADAMSGVDDRPRELVVRTGRDEGGVLLSVQDSGVGFAPEDRERLFEAFYTTKAQGMGIGLSVSRSVIERHHGRLWAVRDEGPGATFTFSVPAGTDTKV